MSRFLKLALALSFVFALPSLTPSAKASGETLEPIWQCALDYDVQGGGIQLIIGHFELSGTGMLKCADIHGNHQEMPVNVQFGGEPIAANAGIGQFCIKGVATGEGYAESPSALMGTYYALGGQGAIAIGAGAHLAFHGQSNAVTLNVAFQVVEGLGVSVGLNSLTISPR